MEDAARRRRYRALGTACSRHRIRALLLGHHRDDQAETVLSRIAGGYVGGGLAGMRSQAALPACLGEYGAHESGAPRRLREVHRSVPETPASLKGRGRKGQGRGRETRRLQALQWPLPDTTATTKGDLASQWPLPNSSTTTRKDDLASQWPLPNSSTTTKNYQPSQWPLQDSSITTKSDQPSQRPVSNTTGTTKSDENEGETLLRQLQALHRASPDVSRTKESDSDEPGMPPRQPQASQWPVPDTQETIKSDWSGRDMPSGQLQALHRASQDTSGTTKSDDPEQEMLVESGGVTLVRPLLEFSKTQLAATCEGAGVSWVEDETNRDRGLTVRNTVRYLQDAELLPAALRTPRMVALSAVVGQTTAALEAEAAELMRSLDVRLDLRTGSVTCTVPASVAATAAQDAIPGKAHLLRALLRLVSPAHDIQIRSLSTPNRSFLAPGPKPPLTTTTTGRSGTPPPPPPPPPVQLPQVAGVHTTRADHADGTQVYVLRRAVPHSELAKARTRLPRETSSSDHAGHWTPWTLWDNRYWLRVGYPWGAVAAGVPDGVSVRFWTKADLEAWARREGEAERARMRRRLERAPGTLRQTLPVLVVGTAAVGADEGEGEGEGAGEERIVALPSLGWSSQEWWKPSDDQRGRRRAEYYYDIRYKKVDDALTEDDGPRR